MNEVLDLPAERDLPPGRAARMRAELVGSTSPGRGGPARSSRPGAMPGWPPIRRRNGAPVAARIRRQVVVVAAATAVAVAVGLAVLPTNRDDNSASTVLAMGTDELSPILRQATDWCLEKNDQMDRIPLTTDDLAVAAQRSSRAVLLFLTDSAYLECIVDLKTDRAFAGAVGSAPELAVGSEPNWRARDWLPGLVQRMMLSSTELDNGYVTANGRVSVRVHRLVLEHGDGQHTEARLANGAFGVVSRAEVTSRAELVGYDRQGREIVRQPLFTGGAKPCYTDPDGNVVYGEAGPDCRPAEPWGF